MKKDIITNLVKLKIKSGEASLKEVNSIIKDLEDTLKEYPNGVGLSAIQIEIPKKLGIIRVGKLKIDLINPKIIAKEEKFKMKKESCLSFPNLNLDTIRYNNITIVNNGTEEIYQGMLAVIIQHEIDHMNGIVFIDRKWRK